MPTRSASGLCANYRTRVRCEDSWCRSSGFLPSCCIAIPRRGPQSKAASDASTGSKAKPVRSRALRLQLCPHAVCESAICQSLAYSYSGGRRIGAGRASLCNRDHNSADFRHVTPSNRRPPEGCPCTAMLARTAICPEFLCSALRARADHEGLAGVFRASWRGAGAPASGFTGEAPDGH